MEYDDHVNRAFRIVGQTREAARHELTDEGFLWKCRLNGIAPERAPFQMRYASNAYMKKYTERLAQQERAASF